jgi:AcrR family transcriptional regulator
VNSNRDAQAKRPRTARKVTPKPTGESRTTGRDRILIAIVDLVSEGTYTTTTVAQISKRAGVSTATFYTVFTDKEECFLAAYRHVADELLGKLERRADTTDLSTAWRAALDAIFDLAAEQPGTLLLLASEATLSTRRALEARDQLVADIESVIDGRVQAPGKVAVPDVPAKALVGAALRLLVRRLREKNGNLEELHNALVRWIESYETSGTPRWQTLTSIAHLQAGPPNYAAGLAPPARPSRGRTRLSPEEVAENQRKRILHATAEVTAEKGYAETTVADIVARAGLAREVFYRHYRDKQDAFIDAYEAGFQTLMALAVGAFYTAAEWPERIWAALREYTDFMANFPTFAHLGMVESHTISPELVARVDERVMAFTFFLQEGNTYAETQEDSSNGAVVAEAIAMAMYELVSHMIRHGRNDELPGLLPLMTYIVLAPYTGADAAGEFVERKGLGTRASELA